MSVVIPLRTDIPWYTEIVELGGVQYQLEVAWNTRDQRWYISVADADGVNVATGIPVVVDWPLLERFSLTDLPDGTMMAIDLTGNGEEPDKEDLNDRVKLMFE